MKIEVTSEPIARLAEYAAIPIAFEVNSLFDVAEGHACGEFVLSERHLDVPYLKDYDSIPGHGSAEWAQQYEVSNWHLFGARVEGRRVAGAVAFEAAGIRSTDRRDVAVLWDIRVSPDIRRQGVGTALFRAVESWAITAGCRMLEVETQNINVSACRFYARHGCVLRAVHCGAYPDLPSEIQLIWRKDFAHAAGSNG